MAFVYKSERDFSYNNQEKENPGPGHYLQIENEYSKISERKSPFMSTSKKEALNHKINLNTITPGPGTYFKDKVLSKENDKDNNLIDKNNKNTIYKILDYDEIAKNSKFAKLMQEKLKPVGFLSKNKRFIDKINLNNNPGPGYYNKTDQNFFLEKTKKIEKINSNFNKTEYVSFNNQNKTVSKFYEGPVSIPSKSKNWGYTENKDGEIINNKKEILSEISPCTYDIYGMTNSKWTKKSGLTGIWSRSISKKIVKDKKNSPKKEFILTETNFGSRPSTNNNTNTNFNTKSNFYKSDQNFNTEVSCFSKTGDKSLFGSKFVIKKQIETYLKKQKEKSERKSKIITISDLVENKNIPGPGYYFPKVIDEVVTTEESKQNFGSREPRFKTLDEKSYLGPGCYFNSKEISRTRKIIKAGKSVNKLNRKRIHSSYDFIKKSNSQNPGPGNYELMKDWTASLNNNSNSKAIFGTTENRFVKQKTTCITEGPGSYLPINDNHRKFKEIIDPITKKTFYEKSNEDYLRYNPKRYLKKDKLYDVKKTNKKKQEFQFPSVGDYNPQLIYNIDFRLHKNVTKFSTKIAPFSSSDRRFEKEKFSQEKLNLGPGIYYKEKKLETSKKKMYPFTSSSQRENHFINDSNKVGPGDYNINSWFDWNKKTFNIGYI